MWHLMLPSIFSSFLQILLLMSVITSSYTISEVKCYELSADSECNCTYKWNSCTIKCSGAEIFIDTTRKNETSVVIRGWSEIENNSLPEMDIGSCHDVYIVNCNLFGEPIVPLLQQLGIKNVKFLSIHNNTLGLNFTCLLTGLSGLQGLKLYSNNLTILPAKIFLDLSNVTTLSIHEHLVELPQHIFDSLEKLSNIDLSNNRLNQLPNGIFRNQHQLKKLRLNDNILRYINKTTFEGATSLQILDLRNNNLDSFEPDIFSLLPTLSKIYLDGNEFRKLPSQLFAYNKELTIVHITENSNALELWPSALLANLSHLQEVHISCSNYYRNKNIKFSCPQSWRNQFCISCGFRHIPGNLFTSSSNWADVTLAYNNLRLLPDNIFADQDNLNRLNLSHNKLQSLQIGTFRNARKLILLDLSYNQLTELSDGIFLSLGSLMALYLNNNKLLLLPCDLFLKTTNLVLLELSYNQLAEISAEIFSPLVKLEFLQLDSNHLTTISCDIFSESRNLRYKNMENNHIKFQETALVKTPFQLLKNLQTLKLRNNSVQRMHWNWTIVLPNLEELDLSFNSITTLDFRDFTFQQKRLRVNMSHNQVRTIEFVDANLITETFKQVIDLSCNPLVCDCKLLSFLLYLSRASDHKRHFITASLFCDKPHSIGNRLFRGLTPKELLCSIKHPHCPFGCICWENTYDATLILNCSNINLTKVPVIPDVQATAFKAIELHIENNELHELPTISIDGYAKVTKIYATGNNISQIAVHNLPMELTHMDLSHNNLKRLDPNVIGFLHGSHSLTQLILAGNPWDCNCESRSFFLFAVRQSIITDYKQMFCATPKNVTMHNYFIDNEFCQEDHQVIFTSAVSVLSVCLLVSVIVIVCYKYATEIKILIYSYPCLRGIFSESDVDENKQYDAFVSYSHKDTEFIGTMLVPELERDGPIQFKLCVHVRDFIVGDYIVDQIIRAIDESRRTIIVLSKHFIDSVWANMEFRLAHQAAVVEGRTRIIVIMYGDIGDVDSLEPLLRAYLKTNTYLEWGDPLFWDRLRYAMPHPANAPPNETTQVTTTV